MQKSWYILVSQFTEGENGNRILLNTEVFDSTKKNTFFTLSPGRLDYFQGNWDHNRISLRTRIRNMNGIFIFNKAVIQN